MFFTSNIKTFALLLLSTALFRVIFLGTFTNGEHNAHKVAQAVIHLTSKTISNHNEQKFKNRELLFSLDDASRQKNLQSEFGKYFQTQRNSGMENSQYILSRFILSHHYCTGL